MVIKPVSALRNNFVEISKLVHERHEPVFLTRNGSGDMVVMSMAKFNEQKARLELYAGLARSEADSAAGRVVDFDVVKSELYDMLTAKGAKFEDC